jgi:hypothetical protein
MNNVNNTTQNSQCALQNDIIFVQERLKGPTAETR